MRLVAMKIQQKDSTEKKKEIEKQKLTIRIKPHESGNQITFHISWLQQITRCCYVSVSKSLKIVRYFKEIHSKLRQTTTYNKYCFHHVKCFSKKQNQKKKSNQTHSKVIKKMRTYEDSSEFRIKIISRVLY